MVRSRGGKVGIGIGCAFVALGLVIARSRARPNAPLGSGGSVTSAGAELRQAKAPADSDSGAAAPVPAEAVDTTDAIDVRMVPADDGRIGAWLIAGPFRAGANALPDAPTTPVAVDEKQLDPYLGRAITNGPASGAQKNVPLWQIASAAPAGEVGPHLYEGFIDLQAALHAKDASLVAYAGASVHVATKGRYHLLIGADDGVDVRVDGKSVYARDESRPARTDDDLVPLDLSEGDHSIVLKLHQRGGGWALSTRFLDSSLERPRGAYFRLPGTTSADAKLLAEKLAWTEIAREIADDGYTIGVTARFPLGRPGGVRLPISARISAVTKQPKAEPNTEQPIGTLGASPVRATLAPLVGARLASLEDHDLDVAIQIGSRETHAPFRPRRAVRDALLHADRALRSAIAGDTTWLPRDSRESVENVRRRLARFVQTGDSDADAQIADARELETLATALDKKTDPYRDKSGAVRRAYVSPADRDLSEFALYVPPSYTPDSNRRYPLVVALHGMNGRAMSMLQWFFGFDDGGKNADWEDRHVARLPSFDAFVIAPDAHGNSMFRDFGEDDVVRLVDWAKSTYPIDDDRVTITGPSMGGIGAASVPFHFPDKFAGALPLCGYHSYFVRRDTSGRPFRPWERLLAEERSNVEWATNGSTLPLWIVHGTLDTPVANSDVLIDRYKKLGFSIKHDHPEKGHNVWQETYEKFKGAQWLLARKRNAHPKNVRFRTVRPRYASSFWVHIDELSSPNSWGEIDARVRRASAKRKQSESEPSETIALDVTTKGLGAIHFDRDPIVMPENRSVTVSIDGAALAFAPNEPIAMHMDAGWKRGAANHSGPFKHGDVSGPIRDIFHSPLLFVYGADDPTQARANKEVAEAWAYVRPGTRVKFPIMSDAEFFAQNEPLSNSRSLFLVGNARSNRVVRALESDLPIRVDGTSIVFKEKKFSGRELGAAFIYPNPKNPNRTIVVVEGVDALGTWQSLSLPDLLPDFVVYDEGVRPSRGQILLSGGTLRAGGFFKNDWTAPDSVDDPEAMKKRPTAKDEHDATSYLP